MRVAAVRDGDVALGREHPRLALAEAQRIGQHEGKQEREGSEEREADLLSRRHGFGAMMPKSSAETPREGRSVRVLIVAGPAGAGKTTVGRAAAARLGWAFVDADDYHAADSLRKMARGEGLTDADRAPWLARLAALPKATR